MPTVEGLTIRPVELADVPALLTIIADARREYGIAEKGVELLDPSDRAIYSAYQRQRALYFVALLDGQLVGGAGVAPMHGADPLTCELQRMYLRADVRGRGIGEALLERCLAAAKQFLYVRCYLETVAQMQAAIGFYTRHGFRDLQGPLGETAHPHNDRWMIRALRASARESIERIPARAGFGAAATL
ncbi:MAG TPA: GNAT family N-acetyltransferase [Steroidobacteraceae bacterium]|nr:GNAT family N-acetyltransferase [Steroidobacteraceae bacterium]